MRSYSENKPDSGTLVGTDFVAKAPADGCTLLVGSVSNLALRWTCLIRAD